VKIKSLYTCCKQVGRRGKDNEKKQVTKLKKYLKKIEENFRK
jgi:hypothetical protein